MLIMTNLELLSFLYNHLSVVKDINYKTEFYLDIERTIIYSHKRKDFFIKYTDSPIPYTATIDTIYNLVASILPNTDNQSMAVSIEDNWHKSKGSIAEILRDLFREIEHGDQEHRSWLKNKIEDFIKIRGYV